MNNAATATARTASPVRKLTYSALFLALAMVLPFLTGQIPEIGSMLCPMPVSYTHLTLPTIYPV